ncbi:Gp2.5-like ssDNA binding protein and ssDNA annealing protein [Vibrio phage CP-T1]|uniref:Gp2.5-like ssDNA binding protein and ssDNA annealing protein n=1 Tax=Vibrio phage CP-T1 TaxID=10689 RepID=UPI0002536C95|nr:Gp2.5-like ssDNA binding protein and ssDNA annealing protein [Vibrio phage CP-T1]AFC22387.1 hypothetical protein CP-T1_0005 [Vibrio phage CP-T1]AIR96030.1 hypothetical protein SBVc24_0071 [Vibrio phage 24]
MAQQEIINILTPVGRIISGSCHESRKEDSDGRPLLVKHGPNAGQPREEYGIGLAVPKTQQDWKYESWAAPILLAAHRDFPHLFSAPGQLINPAQPFAWKITDGDSQVPNTRGNKPCDMEGARGNWIIWLNNGYAPKLYKWDAQKGQAVPLAPGEEIKRGYYAEAYGSVQGNNAQGNQSGVYINLSMVCLRAYGDEIVSGPTVEQAGFGGGALPQGASTMPTNNVTPPPAQQSQAQHTPPPPPATDMRNGPQGDIPPPPPPAVDMYTYNGKTQTRDAWKAAGWNDAQIDAHCTKA